jgi:hypothetical protein
LEVLKMRKKKASSKTGWGGLVAHPTAWALESSHKKGKHGDGFAIRAEGPGLMKPRRKGKDAI